MLRTILHAGDSCVPLILRLPLGAFGMFHAWVAALAGLGEGPTPYSEKLAQGLGVAPWLAVTEIIVLVLGGLLILLGWSTRIIALLMAAVIVLILVFAFPQRTENALTVLAYVLAVSFALALVVMGGGLASLDRLVDVRQVKVQAARGNTYGLRAAVLVASIRRPAR